jgi:cytoskeletal protein CcmA (bactofilin family)
MWKRENEPNAPTPSSTPSSTPGGMTSATPITPPSAAPSAPPRRDVEAAPAPPPVRASGEPAGRAQIGGGTIVRGEISGEEDLLIEGRVEGRIDLRQNAVTVGAKGRLVAEIIARIILVDGEVDGNLTAEEQIVVRKSGRVKGDLCAPRVTIEDGARFKGGIDMEPKRPMAATPSRPISSAKSDPIAASLAAAVGASSSGSNG